ncbi:MAG: sugar-binding domain-containing protein [Rikenellaceae bacterium]
MKKMRLMTILCAALALSAMGATAANESSTPTTAEVAKGYPQTDRTKLLLNADWKFHLGDPEAKFYLTSTSDKDWESVTIPHTLELTDIKLNDYQDTKVQETFQRKVGWYRRDIFVPKSDKRVYIEFEGVHQITTLWVNGRKVGTHSVGGYTPFNYDITDFVKRGMKNQITVLADNRTSQVAPPDPGPFDYVKFSGLYRDVYLVEKSPMHISSNLESMNSGVTITTPSVDYVNGNATIDIRTEVHNQSKKSQKATLVQRVVDAKGNVVLKLSETAKIEAGSRYRFAQIGGIEKDLKLWSIDNPNLYMVNTTLFDAEGRAIDVVDNRMGVRKVEYDHETGFKLNGKNIELVGFNRHQHFAYIGDAVPNSLHYRDMVQFKELGLNCVRTAHYPQDDELIKACDELGILVYEEAPTWISMSKDKEWFANFRRATQAMIRNHKNSPSVIIWGAGINHRGAVAESQFVVKQEDPTRLTASQNSRWTGWQTSNWTDIFANMNYGPGIWSREEPLLAMEGWYGPEALAPYFRDPMMPGMISWTAHAYYTFHVFKGMDEGMTVRTRLGAMDAFRYLKEDRLMWYPAEMTSEPYIYVADSWGQDLEMLTVYSNATQIELFVNGKSAGKYEPSSALKYNGLSHAPFEITDLPYEDGELNVVGYRDGRVMAEKSIFTPSEATKLNLIAHTYGVDMLADGNDIVIVHAEVLDKNGMRIRDFEGQISFSIKSGDATIVGDEIKEGFNPVNMISGVGSALIRAGKKAGKIEVTAKCGALSSSTVAFESVPATVDCMAANSYPINDIESIHVDLGGKTQLVQFGWTGWDCEEGKSATAAIIPAQLGNYVAGSVPATTEASEIVDADTAGAYKFTIKSNSADGILRWLGEMNVIGQDNFVYGDGVLAMDKRGVTIEIENLPAGEYTLSTYHHAPSSNTDSMDPNLERLKKESIHKLPYSKSFSIAVDGKKQLSKVVPTSGKQQQLAQPTIAKVKFSAKSDKKVEILFKSNDDTSGIWINGFVLEREL